MSREEPQDPAARRTRLESGDALPRHTRPDWYEPFECVEPLCEEKHHGGTTTWHVLGGATISRDHLTPLGRVQYSIEVTRDFDETEWLVWLSSFESCEMTDAEVADLINDLQQARMLCRRANGVKS